MGRIGIILSLILSIRIFIIWTIYLLVSRTNHSDNLQSEKRINVICRYNYAVQYLRSDVKVSSPEKGLLEKSCLYKISLNQTENKVQLKDFHKLIIFVSVPVELCSDKFISEMLCNKTVLFALSS